MFALSCWCSKFSIHKARLRIPARVDPSTSVFELFMSFRQEEVFFETIYTVSGSPTFSNAPSWASIPMMMVSSVTSRLYGSSGVPKL